MPHPLANPLRSYTRRNEGVTPFALIPAYWRLNSAVDLDDEDIDFGDDPDLDILDNDDEWRPLSLPSNEQLQDAFHPLNVVNPAVELNWQRLKYILQTTASMSPLLYVALFAKFYSILCSPSAQGKVEHRCSQSFVVELENSLNLGEFSDYQQIAMHFLSRIDIPTEDNRLQRRFVLSYKVPIVNPGTVAFVQYQDKFVDFYTLAEGDEIYEDDYSSKLLMALFAVTKEIAAAIESFETAPTTTIRNLYGEVFTKGGITNDSPIPASLYESSWRHFLSNNVVVQLLILSHRYSYVIDYDDPATPERFGNSRLSYLRTNNRVSSFTVVGMQLPVTRWNYSNVLIGDDEYLHFYFKLQENIPFLEVAPSADGLEVNRNRFGVVLNYSASPLRYMPDGIRLDKELGNPLLTGVELEVSTNYSASDIVNTFTRPYLICKSDSSIRGNKNYPMELVTRPASLKVHKLFMAELFSKLDVNQFDISSNTGNGMHVHIARDAFYYTSYTSRNDPHWVAERADYSNHLRHVNLFTWFFTDPSNYEFIFAMSGRDRSSLNRWAPLPTYDHVLQLHNEYSNIRYRKQKNHASLYVKQLRGTINISQHTPTIEVRLFKGIVNFERIIANLEFVEAVFYFTSQASRSKVGWRDFIEWLEKEPRNRYRTLRNHLTTTILPNLGSVDHSVFTPAVVPQTDEHKKFSTHAPIGWKRVNGVKKVSPIGYAKQSLKKSMPKSSYAQSLRNAA